MLDDPQPSIAVRQPALLQAAQTTLGELTGFAVSIGAVYASERLCPNQVRRFTESLAKKLGEWRKLPVSSQEILAQKITDIGLMQMGGIANLGVQFSVRRSAQHEDEKQSLPYEIGRLLAGRFTGTATAMMTLAAVETKTPKLMQGGERVISRMLGHCRGSERFAELVMSNAVQTAGGMMGNAPAQLLYDKLLLPASARAK